MKRFILALLALIGLVAQAAPAQARLGAVGGGVSSAQVGLAVQRQVPAQKLAACRAIPVQPTGEITGLLRETGRPSATAPAAFVAPTVRLKTDRARE
jgi:hypothetical protein